jgi:hypothetical protein
VSNWTLAILPLLGVLLGAALQFWFSRRAERSKAIESLRAEAYVDYLSGVAASAYVHSDEDIRIAHRALADAKARIAVYGSPQVISALARFEESGAVLARGNDVKPFLAVVACMRSEAPLVAEHDLELLLLGRREKASPKP